MSAALFGIDHGGHARNAVEPSVEDPLEDWVEEDANEGDRWLRERGGESVQQPPE